MRSKYFFIIYFFMVSFLLAQKQTEKIIEHKRKNFRFIQFEYVNHENRIQYVDHSKLYLINTNKLSIINLNNLTFSENPIQTPSMPLDHGYSQLKFRFGDWYCRRNNVIYKYSNDEKKWNVIFDQIYQFSQFEVDPDKLLYLICSGKPQFKESRSNQHSYLDDAQDSSINALVVFSDPSGTPLKKIALPEGFAFLERQVSLLYGLPHSFWHDGQMILYSQDLGIVWCYEPVNHRLTELEVPWDFLGKAYLEKSRPAVALTVNRAGTKGVSQLDFPDFLGFFPYDDGRMFVVLQSQSVTQKKVDEAMAYALNFPYSGSFLLPEIRPSRIGFFEFDTLNHKIRPKTIGREEAERLRKVIQGGDWDNRWVTLDGMVWVLRPYLEPEAPAPVQPRASPNPS